MNTLNLHPLFTATITDCFEQQISLSPSDKSDLMAARTMLRNFLRTELPKRFAAARLDSSGKRVAPKFITQGSYAYRLINAPAFPPRQQADLDDGIYVPLSFCEDTGSPKAVSRLLIEMVETAITELAKSRKWHVVTDNPNCTRIVVAEDKHIDVPLYSIPDDDFSSIAQEQYLLAKSALTFDEYFRDEALDDRWELMPPKVRLAHKTLGWVDSDPRPIKEWIERQVLLKSEQLRRLMRYLKAWRDAQAWPNGDPKSLLLMALVDAALDRRIEGRDDLALIKVCERIPELLQESVSIPVIPEQDLAKQLDQDGIRSTLVKRIGLLRTTLSDCVSGRHTPTSACETLRQQFGTRFPNRPDRIRVESPEDTVHAIAPRRIVAAPIVGRREAG